MIKLNNKNITYVALADSNNSLKAPKEIWYADSNNSVKLVYRRKDALIEGEDYEKYHWLDGDGTAYINTLIIVPNEIVSVKTRIINTSNDYDESIIQNYNSFPFSNRNDAVPQPQVSVIQRRDLSKLFNDIFSPRQEISYAVGDIIEIDVATSRVQNGQATLHFFYSDASNLTPKCWDGKISDFKVESLESDFNISLTPCKLLKPVPKWLDANGIRRQVGECGMIDLVSGKFYGNVNSVGTFTVENYYERKEWLIADIPSNTRCIDLPINSNKMSYSMLIKKASNNTFFETISNYRYYTTTGSLPSIRVWDIPTSSEVNIFNVGLQENELFNITSNESSLTINGVEVQKIGFPISAVVLRSGVHTNNGITETSSVFVDEIERYIPCTLTMDLPASMDANNIARTKGTSGMWDLVSDRFYGNVANSGTFKAVNLAEGVDYEVHDWLVGDGSAYIDTLITSYSGIIKVAFKSTESVQCAIFGRERSISDYTDRIVLLRYRGGNNLDISELYGSSNPSWYKLSTDLDDEEITIDLDNQVMTNKSGDSVQISVGVNVEGPSIILFGKRGTWGTTPSSIAPSDVAIKEFSVSNKIDLTPVKLLRSIPAKYDANGIARQVGECGMYDTVNDKFYGNVASSGTFSVSDDS